MRLTTKSMVSAAALALLLGGRGLPARADDSAVRKSIQGVYAQYSSAFKSGDPKTAIRLLQTSATPDFSTRTKAGQVVTRQQMIAQLQKSAGGPPKGGNMTMSLLTLKVNGGTAVTTSSRKMSASQKDPQGKNHTISVNSITRDSWVKAGNAWKIRKSEEVSGSLMMDGKPFNPAAMMPRGRMTPPPAKR